MNTSKETTLLLNAETVENLNKSKDNEIVTLMKLRLVMKALHQIRPTKLELMDDGERVDRSLKRIRVADYMLLDTKENDHLLNLQDIDVVSLNYTERKAVRNQLIRNLEQMLQPLSALAQRIHTELGDIMQIDPQTDQPLINSRIIELEKKRRDNFKKLTALRNEKCTLLKAAAEVKNGPYLGNELELLYANARSNMIKTNLLRGYFINHLCTQTEHSVKAIQEVHGYIKEAVDQIKDD